MLQVYPFKGEAVQMPRVWKGLLSIQNVGSPQNPSHGGVTSQVSGLQQEFQPKVEFEDPFTNSHRHKTL
jgi:hypothetical protein